MTQDGIYEVRKSCPLALAALVNADNAQTRPTDVREELVVAIQGLRNNDLRNLSSKIEATRNDLGTTQTGVKNLPATIQNLQGKLGQLEQSISGLTRRVDGAEATVQNLAQALADLKVATEEIRQTVAMQNSLDLEPRSGKLRIAVVMSRLNFARVFAGSSRRAQRPPGSSEYVHAGQNDRLSRFC